MSGGTTSQGPVSAWRNLPWPREAKPAGSLKVGTISARFPALFCVFCQKADRLSFIFVKLVRFRVKIGFFGGHFVNFTCVFMNIAGSIFIFNISKCSGVIS
jgi:hypothetical protein